MCGCLGRVEYNFVLNIRQGGDPKSFASRVRVGNTSGLLPQCRGCSPCSAVVTHWSPYSSAVGPAGAYVCLNSTFLLGWCKSPCFPQKPHSLYDFNSDKGLINWKV